jgi:hypothetical protein
MLFANIPTSKNLLPQGLGTGALFTNNFETNCYFEGSNVDANNS